MTNTDNAFRGFRKVAHGLPYAKLDAPCYIV